MDHQGQSEAQIQAARIGGAKPLRDGRIILVDYDSAWPALFDREAARVRSVLGERVRLLEHVGSTSVRGLLAKPIVDMLLAVPDSSDEAAYVPLMQQAGYVLRIREPEWHWPVQPGPTRWNVHRAFQRVPPLAREVARHSALAVVCMMALC